jgi:hypothetical protein
LSSLPNGFSSGDGISETKPYDKSDAYTFNDGLSIVLRARVIDYADRPSTVHPGLYFDYELSVLSGSVDSFSASGWAGTTTFVKVCGIALCGGSGANGVAPTDVSRSSNGDVLTWNFNNLTAGQHSANLQIFSSATAFVDPLAFITDGSGNTFSIETVAPMPSMPLPSSAPLFGAAVIGLGVLGYRLRRRGAPPQV